jgi:hypothetical protein
VTHILGLGVGESTEMNSDLSLAWILELIGKYVFKKTGINMFKDYKQKIDTMSEQMGDVTAEK